MAASIPWTAPAQLIEAWSGATLARGPLEAVARFYSALPWETRRNVDCLKCSQPIPIAGRAAANLNRVALDELAYMVPDAA